MRPSESGFTLVELLVTIAILMILSAIALTGFSVYKDQAYQKIAEQIMNQARTALEAGKQDTEASGGEAIEVDQNASGLITVEHGQTLMPGLVLPEHFRLYALHDPSCSEDACMEDYILARHCKTGKKVVYFRTYGGIESLTTNVDDDGPCA